MKHRVFLDNGETVDFDSDYKLHIADDYLLVTRGYKYADDNIIARFPSIIWRYHQLVNDEPIKNYLFYHWNDKYFVDTGHSLVTETKEARYLTEDDEGQTVKDWAVIFEFNHHGFEIVNINDGVSQGTIEMACQAVLAYVVDRLKTVRELKEISKGETK